MQSLIDRINQLVGQQVLDGTHIACHLRKNAVKCIEQQLQECHTVYEVSADVHVRQQGNGSEEIRKHQIDQAK